MRELSYAAAISEAIRDEMARDESVFLIGEDIGPVREADDLWAQFRARRVWQTPISESGFTGLAVGAAAVGMRPIVDIMYCDFVTVAMDQICNQAAKLRLMSGGQLTVPMVVKTPAGCGTREGAHHSQSLEAWFMHTPGLKVVLPGTPADAKGLMTAAIRDDGPVVFIQHRRLHGRIGDVPEGEWLVPLGQADVKRTGRDITLVAASYALIKALAAAEALASRVAVEVVDPRTIAPLDVNTIVASVRKTGRLLVVHEAPERGGYGAEVVRCVTERLIGAFKTAPRVLGAAHVPMPYSPPLEDACIPQVSDIIAAVQAMVPGR
jgi:pyruvate/2-oxoglutarate/acetoin dehydrogenase E1 component